MEFKDYLHSIGITPVNTELFKQACIHRSAVNENPNLNVHNERLEFLGDAVLELITTEYLYYKFPQTPEGTLTALRSSLVKGETLADLGKEIQIGSWIQLSQGEKIMNGHLKESIIANTIEALIGAIYIDQGIQASHAFITQHLTPKIEGIVLKGDFIDAKSYFQQYAQAEYKKTPVYREIAQTGPDHDKVFTVGVYIDTTEYGRGQGSSKQQAQQSASRQALDNLHIPWKNILVEACDLKSGL